MTGSKLTAMIVFGALGFVFAFLFTVGLVGGFGAVLTGAIAAAATCALIVLVDQGEAATAQGAGKRAFGRGFMALGAVFILVPVTALGGWAEQAGEISLVALGNGDPVSSAQASEFVLTSILASAGMIFGMVVGLILVLIGGLMHAGKRRASSPPVPRVPPVG